MNHLKSSKKQIVPFLLLMIPGGIAALYAAAVFDSSLRKEEIQSYKIKSIINFIASGENGWKLFLCLFIIILLCIGYLVLMESKEYKSDQIMITPEISIPVSAGQGQCGTARWLSKKKYREVFGSFILDINKPTLKELLEHSNKDIEKEIERIKKCEKEIAELEEADTRESFTAIKQKQHELSDATFILKQSAEAATHDYNRYDICKKEVMIERGGIVIGKEDLGEGKERIYYNPEDTHTLVIGATRSSKTRTIVLETIGCLALAGESIIATDPKGEIYDYTNHYLRALGYHIITLDFKNPRKSQRYNFLQPIIDYVDNNDIPGAIDATWDITSQLVGEAKGEKLWTDGEASMIAACIMAVVYDNRAFENKKYQNLTNVFYFISQMCTPIQVGNAQVLPLNRYVKDLDMDHPSKGLLSVGEIAPSRTRGSFYTSALMTLKLFTNPLIADMTSVSDYDAMEIGNEKTAVFIILPDEKKTYHSLASLYVNQQYQLLSKAADLRGGRLKRRVNYVCDEFGNFVKIPIFATMLTVSGGKGIRFNLFLQGFSQLEEVYEETTARTIVANCENWIYLQTDDEKTLESLSKKLGKYTISTYSLSTSHAKYSNPNSSHSISLTGRELLMPDEIKKIKRPYSLVTSRNDPAIFFAPDLSKWNFNKLYGLGDEEFNRRVRLARENIREERKVITTLILWGIWDVYIEIIRKEKLEKEQRALMAQMATQMSAHAEE